MTPVLLITGDDELLLQREVERMLAELHAEDDDLTVDRYDVGELDQLPELRTTSLFGGRTVVVLRGLEAIGTELKAELETYLADPSPDTVLLLVTRGTGKIQKVAKLAGEHGERREVKTPADWDERGWGRLIGEEFRRLGRKADATAVTAIRTHAGDEPSAIASQVATVCASQAEAATLTGEHVDAVIEGQGRTTGFAVADAIADRDPAAALTTLRGALGAGDAPLAVLGAITYRLRQLL
ncbi:MAG: DNA polymerase III subunit delta, partial [Nitriliruptoraceae bacterium]